METRRAAPSRVLWREGEADERMNLGRSVEGTSSAQVPKVAKRRTGRAEPMRRKALDDNTLHGSPIP